MANPGAQTGTVGTAVSKRSRATDSAGKALTFSATGLPAGLSISTAGLISGTPTTAATYTVTVTALLGARSVLDVWEASGRGQPAVYGSDSALARSDLLVLSGLLAVLSISSSLGLISVTPTTVGHLHRHGHLVRHRATGSASFAWTVNPVGGGCAAAQLLGNPGFETGSAAPWTTTAGVVNSNGAGDVPLRHLVRLARRLRHHPHRHRRPDVTIPATCKRRLHLLAARRHGGDHHDHAFDKLTVQVLNSPDRAGHAGDVLEPEPRHRLHPATFNLSLLHRAEDHAEVHRHRGRLAADVLRDR